jgi:hypothetical protein
MAPGEHAGQENAVVVAVRLVAENDDVELVGAAAGEYILDQPCAGHAVADHHQTPFRGHCAFSRVSTRTAHVLKAGMRLVGSSAAIVSLFADPSPPQ